jgi:alginate O-acetyltransferase complex protein AlgI
VLFTEPTFLFAFLPLLLAIYYVTPLAARNALLVVASVLFYARDGGAFTWLILASIVINTVAAVWVDRLRGTRAATRLLVVIVALNLLSLATFKYSGFLIDNLNLVLGASGREPLAAPQLLLPIGISFFTFHSISYIVDVYRRQAVAQKGPVGAARTSPPRSTRARTPPAASRWACGGSSSASPRSCWWRASSPVRPTPSSRCRPAS